MRKVAAWRGCGRRSRENSFSRARPGGRPGHCADRGGSGERPPRHPRPHPLPRLPAGQPRQLPQARSRSSLLLIDLLGLAAAIFSALASKALLGRPRPRRGSSSGTARLPAVRLPGHDAALRARRPLRLARDPARPGADVATLFQVTLIVADLRARQRRRVLDLLALLRRPRLRGALRRRSAPRLRGGDRPAAQLARLPAPRRAGRHRRADRRRRPRARGRAPATLRDGRLLRPRRLSDERAARPRRARRAAAIASGSTRSRR